MNIRLSDKKIRVADGAAFVTKHNGLRIYEFGRATLDLHGPPIRLRKLIQSLDGTHTVKEASRRSSLPLRARSGGTIQIVETLLEHELAFILDCELPQGGRYDRQLRYFLRCGGAVSKALEWHRQLRNSRVALIGMGGAGQTVAYALAAAGIGELVMVDPDEVEVSNLNRHPLTRARDVGKPKVELARQRLLALNPDLHITADQSKVKTEEQVKNLASHTELIVCTADDPPVRLRRQVNAGVLAAGQAACLFFGGWRVGPFVIPGQTACWACVEDMIRNSDDLWDHMVEEFQPPACPPSIATVPGVAGNLAAHESLKFLGSFAEVATAGAVLTLDPGTLSIQRTEVAPNCTHYK